MKRPLEKNNTAPTWLLIGLLALVLFMTDLGRLPFIDRDEGEYSTVAYEMIQRDDWVIPM